MKILPLTLTICLAFGLTSTLTLTAQEGDWHSQPINVVVFLDSDEENESEGRSC